MKPVDVKSSTYINFGKKNDDKDPKFKVGDHVKIWKHKNCFAKCYVPIWFEEVLKLKKLKILCCGHMLSVIVLFLLSSSVAGPSFISISSLVLEFGQFTFIRNWSEICKLEIRLSEFCLTSGNWGKLGIPNMAPMFLMKCYEMLENARVTAYTVSELLSENQQLPPTQIRVKMLLIYNIDFSRENAMYFPINNFSPLSKNSWFNTAVIFSCFCFLL